MTARPVSRKSENSANLKKSPISSAAARRLCEAAVKRHGSLRKAAKALGLKSHGQLYQIMKGRMRDTAEMRAALRRADRRAKRAWELVRDEGPSPHVDVDALRGAISVVERQLKMMRELMKRVVSDGQIAGDAASHPNCRCVLLPAVPAIDPQPEVTDEFVRTVMAEQQAPGAFSPSAE